jgi:ABC-type transport system involved in multi-copper enzyme maturation permease subunit
MESHGLLDGSLILQLLFGLLVLSAMAPTALAEERVRGSLDVLLTTPLSTSAIVMGKWWGMYRRVLVLALLPLYAGVVIAVSLPSTPSWATPIGQRVFPLTAGDRILAATCCLGDFLASCAVIVSLGLALATWVRRLGRAVALSVIAYFLTGIVWVDLVAVLFLQISRSQMAGWTYQNRWLEMCAMSLSPIFGTAFPLLTLNQDWSFQSRTPIWVCIQYVILIKASIAGLLLWLTIKTFDRCLGRVSESRFPTSTWVPVVGEELAPTAA